MQSTVDFFTALTLLGLTLFALLVYFVRVALRGHAQFERVDKQGESPLMGKSLMEAAHWLVQPVLKGLAFLGVTPNQVSWSSLFFGVVAAYFLALGQFGLGAAFSLVAAFADLIDGSLARLTGVASDAGEVLDATLDRYVEFFFISGLLVYYRSLPLMQIVCLVALLGSFMVSYSTAKAEALGVALKSGAMRRPERAFYLILGATLAGASVPVFELQHKFASAAGNVAVTVGATAVPVGYPMAVALIMVAIISNVVCVRRFVALASAIRAREAAARHAAGELAQSLVAGESSAQRSADLSTTAHVTPDLNGLAGDVTVQ